jgi:hypothetical protein
LKAYRAAIAAASLGASAACYVAVPDPVYTPCRIAGSSDWRAEIEETPGGKPRLLVSGKVTVPTGGHAIALELGYVEKLDSPRQQVILRSVPPEGAATEAIVTEDVTASFPLAKDIGAVTVRCGDKMLAVVALPPRAR